MNVPVSEVDLAGADRRQSTESATARHERERTCVGCRETADRNALLRFVADGTDGQAAIAPDIRRRAPGRGVSVHPRFSCVEAAVRTGALRRGLELETTPSARELAASAVAQYTRRAEGLLLAARRSRHLALGTEAVRETIATRSVRLLIVAHDAEGSREELTGAAKRLGRSCLVWSNQRELGRLCGRALLSIVAVSDAGIAHELWHVVRSAAELAEDA